MSWGGYWGMPWGIWAWVFPLIGLLFMAVMVFVCVRMMGGMAGGGCMMGHGRRPTDETEALRREVGALKDEIQKLRETR